MVSLFLDRVPQLLSRMETAVRKDDLAEVPGCRAGVSHCNAGDVRFPSQRIGGARKRRIHLTFDDGPHPINTPKLLDELKQSGILATFFVIGKNLKTPLGQELIQRAVAEGHQIGNHTYSHPHLTELTEDQIREEILKTEQLIGNADRGVKIFRPPYGEHNSLVDQVAKKLGYRLAMWNVDSRDWDPSYQDRWGDHAMEQIITQKESILLAHDSQITTVAKIATFIANARELSNCSFIQCSEAFPRKRASLNLSYLRTLLPSKWRDLNHALKVRL